MSAFKKYFTYNVFMTICGIPYIILEGTLKDWENILEKLNALSNYGFKRDKMEKDIKEIINTKKGEINLDFWRKIIMETKKDENDWKGCGSEGEDKIFGWICDFYYGLGDTISRDSNLVDEVLEVPIKITEICSEEKTIDGEIRAGILHLKQDPHTFVVEPIVDFCFLYGKHLSFRPFG